MYEKIIDKIFGTMEYQYSWEKEDEIKLFGNEYKIKVVAQAYEETEHNIVDIQRENYKEFKKFIELHEEEIYKALEKYCKEKFGLETIKLKNCMTPSTIIFERDDSWGILFDTEYDVENGIALFVVNNQIKVDEQNIFL